MKRRLIAVLLLVLLCISCVACSGSSDERSAVETIKTFIKAVEENDTETQQECMDPSVNAVNEGLVNSVASIFKISDGYDLANGAMSLTNMLAQDALNIEVSLDFNEVLESSFSDNVGTVTVSCELSVKSKETNKTAKNDISWCFHMVKKSSDWYILYYDSPVAVSDDGEQQAQAEINSVGTIAQGITYGKPFSDDVAWVTLKKPAITVCVDKFGKILFAPEDGHIVYGEEKFYNGVCILRDSNNQEYKMIDKKGNTVFLFKDGDTKLDVSEFVEGGFTIVTGTYESIKGTESKIGLLDAKGQWAIPLSSDILRIEFCGEGMFLVTTETEEKLYNSAEKQMYAIQTPPTVTDKSFVPTVEFLNGKCTFIATIPDENNLGYGYIVALDTHGIIDVLFETPYPHTKTCGNMSDGLIFVSEFKSLGNEQKAFFDINGNKVIDLSEYEQFYTDKPYFINGYCSMNINDFCLVIDKQGNEMFEPIKMHGSQRSSETCGKIVNGLIGIYNADGPTYYYDLNGNAVVGPIDSWNDVPEISCERIMGRSAVGADVHYYDLSGNLVF